MTSGVDSEGDVLWDPARGSFAGSRLRRAIVARGWTPEEFAQYTGLHATSIYNALHGRRVRDTTAIKIFAALEKRQPMTIAVA